MQISAEIGGWWLWTLPGSQSELSYDWDVWEDEMTWYEEHVDGVLDQFDDIFHGLVAVELLTFFFTANQILSEMAENWWNGMLGGQDVV